MNTSNVVGKPHEESNKKQMVYSPIYGLPYAPPTSGKQGGIWFREADIVPRLNKILPGKFLGIPEWFPFVDNQGKAYDMWAYVYDHTSDIGEWVGARVAENVSEGASVSLVSNQYPGNLQDANDTTSVDHHNEVSHRVYTFICRYHRIHKCVICMKDDEWYCKMAQRFPDLRN